MTVRIIVSAAVALAALGCATGERAPQDDASHGAMLEVENRTSEDLAIAVRGRVEGIARSGARLRVRHLGPGPAALSARAVSGGRGAFEAKLEVVLAHGEIVPWSIVPDEAGGEALPEVPALGALVVENPSPRDIVVLVDGQRLGRVFARQTRRFEDLPSGMAKVGARPDDNTAPSEAELMIPPGQEVAWRFEQSGAALTIENATDEAIAVKIDGVTRARIAPGERWTSTEAPGLRVLNARSEPSQRPYEEMLELTEGTPALWQVMAGQAALVVENATGEALSLRVPGREAVVVAPREHVRFEDLATGSVAVEARGQATKTAYAALIELLAGQEVTWVAGPVLGSIRVENRTNRELTIYTGEAGREVERGRIGAGATALVRDLLRSNVAIAAVGMGPGGGAWRQATTIDLSETPAATWVVSALTGAVRVDNASDEAVDVFVDAARVGEVPAGAARTFTGVEVGARLIECVAQTSGRAQRAEVVVGEDALATMAVRDLAAWVVIANRSGERLVTQGILAEQVETIEHDATIRFKVPASAPARVGGPAGQRLGLIGGETGFVYAKTIAVAPGESERWEVVLEPGRVVVWSRLDESVAVTIDGRAQGSLAPDETLAIDGVAPGRHRLQVVGLRSGLVRTEEVAASPGGVASVTFAMELGVLLVENRAQEPVEVAIDGALYGEVAGGALHAFGKVAPGAREVELYFSRSRRTQRVALEIREGQRARVVAEAPLGVLVVDNSSHQDVKITVDGTPLAVVPADAGPTLVNAPAGARHVRIERLGDRSELGFQLQIDADVAVHVPVPPRTVRLVVVNRGDGALELFAGEHPLGRIAARASIMIEEVPDGEARLFAKDAEGRVTHEELRRLHAGETATWVLAAP